MADFCAKCCDKLFGEDRTPDIDVEKEFSLLKEGEFASGWICEGCGLSVIGNVEGELKVIRIPLDEDEDVTSEWENY